MNTLLTVEKLRKCYATSEGNLIAVDGLSFEVGEGETVALVGESGCGKSTVALTLLRLIQPDGGHVVFDNVDFSMVTGYQERQLRRQVSIVFQNPYSSLDPKMTVKKIVGEPLTTAFGLRGRALTARVTEHLQDVGLGAQHLNRYPHQFSGGQRQRIAIARALALEPRLLVLDEPTSALDVSVQAQVLNLLKGLQRRHRLSYLFISHNLATVEFMADRVIVMYLGRIVETGSVDEVFSYPRHPYTQALINSIPSTNPRMRNRLRPIKGEVPSPIDRPAGCPFEPRCSRVLTACNNEPPDLAVTPDGQRAVACFNPLDKEIGR